MNDVLALSAVDQAALIRGGKVSALEVVTATLARIEQLNPVVNAFVAVCAERAVAEAEMIAAGDPRPLCGLPIGVKDLLSATAGLPTTHGSAGFGDWVADHDTAHVRRLREAGAIIVGKTNTPELGLRPVTENERFGPTRNPWNTDLSAGGSSGGSAAATAAGMVALADGSDLGGSIRIPASCCGLVGLKPSRGRVSLGPDYGAVGLGMPSDGILTRTVLDTATALDVVAGYEPGDHQFLPAPRIPYAQAALRPPASTAIMVAPTAPLGVPTAPEALAAVRHTADALANLGHHVQEGTPDWEDDSFPESWGTFMGGTLQHLVRVVERLHGRAVLADHLEAATRAWAVDSTPVTLIDYLEAAERLWAYSRRVIRSWPLDSVLLTPTLTRLPAKVAALRSTTGVTDDALRFSALVRIWNVTGQPAITVPLYETGGIPVGIQLVGPPGRDDLVVSLAAQLENAVGRRPRGIATPEMQYAITT
jgi:amidase